MPALAIVSWCGAWTALAASIRSLIAFVEQLRDRGVDFRSLNEGIDTTTATAGFSFTSWRRWRNGTRDQRGAHACRPRRGACQAPEGRQEA